VSSQYHQPLGGISRRRTRLQRFMAEEQCHRDSTEQYTEGRYDLNASIHSAHLTDPYGTDPRRLSPRGAELPARHTDLASLQ